MAVVVAAGVVAAPSDAQERLALRVSPAVALAPADLLIRADVAADAANRRIEVVAESDAYYRSSEMQLNGARGPRVTTVTFRGLPGGAYAVRATLKGQDGRTLFQTHTTVNVVDGDASR
jgi:hypothetical protein